VNSCPRPGKRLRGNACLKRKAVHGNKHRIRGVLGPRRRVEKSTSLEEMTAQKRGGCLMGAPVQRCRARSSVKGEGLAIVRRFINPFVWNFSVVEASGCQLSPHVNVQQNEPCDIRWPLFGEDAESQTERSNAERRGRRVGDYPSTSDTGDRRGGIFS
jgi:hypothetical protein